MTKPQRTLKIVLMQKYKVISLKIYLKAHTQTPHRFVNIHKHLTFYNTWWFGS